MRLCLLLVCALVPLGATLAYCQDPDKKDDSPPQKEQAQEKKGGRGFKGQPPDRGQRGSRGAAGQTPDGVPQPSARGFPGPPGQPHWEYDVQTADAIRKLGDGDVRAGLNQLGLQGWEFVSVEPGADGPRNVRPATYYFKRGPGPFARMGGMAGMGGGMGFPPGGAGGGANPGGGIGGPGGFPGAGGPTPGAAGPQGGAFPGGGPGGFQGGRGFPAAEPQRLGDFHIHPLKHIRAGSVVQIVNQLYGPARGGPRLAADDASNSLIVAGTEQQVHDVLKLVTRLEEVSKEAVEDRTKRQAKE